MTSTAGLTALCAWLLAMAVGGAPTADFGCVQVTADRCCLPLTCPPGQYGVVCQAGKPSSGRCEPCPEGTFSHTDSDIGVNCTTWKTCELPYMSYTSKGSPTADAVCGCLAPYVTAPGGGCRIDGSGAKSAIPPDRTHLNELAVGVNSSYPEGTYSQSGTPQDPGADGGTSVPPFVGWTIVIAVTTVFILLMLVFWFWTPCLRGEPDYGDGQREVYTKVQHGEELKLMNRELTDAENELAVTYALGRLPELLTPSQEGALLGALIKDVDGALPEEAIREELDPKDTTPVSKSLATGFKMWQEKGVSFRFSSILEALETIGNNKQATLLQQEIQDQLKEKGLDFV